MSLTNGDDSKGQIGPFDESILDLFDRMIEGKDPADWSFWGEKPDDVTVVTAPFTAEEMADRYRDFIKEHPYEDPNNRPGDGGSEGGGGAAEG